MSNKRPQRPASKIRQMLEKLERGEPIDTPESARTIYYIPKDEEDLTGHFEDLNHEVEKIIDISNWEPPVIHNSLGLWNYVNRATTTFAEDNPKLKAQMLQSVFDLICQTISDKTSRQIANAILSHNDKR
jgi:uncharacterized protein YneF (UPF0154 family)